MNKIIVVDMDGTLIDHENKYDIKFMEKIKNEKTDLIIATGRLIHDIKYIEKLTDYKCKYKIAQNGCVIYDKDNVLLRKETMELEKTKKILKLLKKINGVRIEVNTDTNRYMYEKRPVEFAKEYKDSSIIGNIEDNLKEDPVGILIIVEKSKLEEIYKLLSENIETKEITINKSSQTSIEIFNSNSSKGNALKTLNLEKKYDEINIYGDSENDISMLKENYKIKKRTFGMRHGSKSIQKHCDYLIKKLFHGEIINKINQKLIVSCQALENEPLHSSYIMSKMAKAAEEGGASSIRANSIEDILKIKKEVDLPIIGIIKRDYTNSEIYITPTIKEIDELVKAEVDIIAMDATINIRPNNMKLIDFVKNIKKKYPEQLLMADCSTVEEVEFANKIGFDIISSTLVGYTKQSQETKIESDDFKMLKEMLKITQKYKNIFIAEGNIDTPEKCKRVLNIGVHSVVVGSMITRPQVITKRFVDKMKGEM